MAELIEPPLQDDYDRHNHVYVKDDLEGKNVEELLRHALDVAKTLEEQLHDLHKLLPRSAEQQVKEADATRGTLRECIRGAKRRLEIVRESLETPKGRT